jgi:Clostridial hydrophobic W
MSAEDTNATSEPTGYMTPPPPVPAELREMVSREPEERAFGPRHIWYTVYGSGKGWAPVVRDGQRTGRFEGGSGIEAAQIMVVGTPWIWVIVHMQTLAWQQGWVLAQEGDFVTVGMPGKSKRMEALQLQLPVDDGDICAEAYVQGSGWQRKRCARDVTVGTTGKRLRMEALSLTVRD